VLLHKGNETFLLGVQELGNGQVVLEAVNGDVVLGTILALLADKGFVGQMTLAILDEPGGLVDNSPEQIGGSVGIPAQRAWLIKRTSLLAE
jgi:hypothetical protein